MTSTRFCFLPPEAQTKCLHCLINKVLSNLPHPVPGWEPCGCSTNACSPVSSTHGPHGKALARWTPLRPAGGLLIFVCLFSKQGIRKVLEELDSKQVHEWKSSEDTSCKRYPREKHKQRRSNPSKISKEIICSMLLRCYFYFRTSLT